MIRDSITHNLTGLFRFSGRDNRARFWPYTIAVYVVGMSVFMLIVGPRMMIAASRFIRHGAAPFPDTSDLLWWTAVVIASQVFLLAAAVTRRLRDRHKPIGWALLPLVLLAVHLLAFGDPRSAFLLTGWTYFAAFLLNIGYLASVIFLIVLLAGASPEVAEAGKVE